MNEEIYQNLMKEKTLKEETNELTNEGENTSQGTVLERLQTMHHEDIHIFLLNNIFMSVQFFKNYDRDVENLRENWFKDMVLKGLNKKCFFADSLFKKVDFNVKFQPQNGKHQGLKSQLHPLRIFLSNDNVEAVYDPASLRDIKTNVRPFYQFTVKPCEDNKKEQSGYISLVEFQTIEQYKTATFKEKVSTENSATVLETLNSPTKEPLYRNSIIFNSRKTTNSDGANLRRMTKTEKLLSLHNKTSNFGKIQRHSLRFLRSIQDKSIPHNGFYNYMTPEERLKPQPIYGYRMNNLTQVWERIPKQCFQTVDVKKSLNLRRLSNVNKSGDKCFMTHNFLNSAAYKGHFCDVLIEKLAEVLNFESDAVNEAEICEEFIKIDLHENQYLVTPVVNVRDWNKHLEISKKVKNRQNKQIQWPTASMKKIIQLLPCYAAPVGCLEHFEDNTDFEKEWKLVFPKAEEFLLLHMMHAHIRCFLFVMAVYKTFIEHEINSSSFGPKHLLHLLFWLVHKDFLAWPEDKPGESFLNYLKILYKKLQNKSLSHFFITSRNLFAHSFLRDIHKVQAIIKKILENPVPYVLIAIRNLYFKPEFYPTFDALKFHTILIGNNAPENKAKLKLSPKSQETKSRKVRFEEDEERYWKKTVLKQIYLEKKIEKMEEENRNKSVDSIIITEIPLFDSENFQRFNEILKVFINHFLEMGIKSAEHKTLNQALTYLNLINKLIELLTNEETEREKFQKNSQIKNKISQLKKECNKLKKNYSIKPTSEENVNGDAINQKQSNINVNKTETSKIITVKNGEDGYPEIINRNDSDTDDEMETKL